MELYLPSYYTDGQTVYYLSNAEYINDQLLVCCCRCERMAPETIDLDTAFMTVPYRPVDDRFHMPYAVCRGWTWLNTRCLSCHALYSMDINLWKRAHGEAALPDFCVPLLKACFCEIRSHMGRINRDLRAGCDYWLDRDAVCYTHLSRLSRPTIREFTRLFHSIFDPRLRPWPYCHGIRSTVYSRRFDSPFDFLMPSEIRAFLRQCAPDRRLFGGAQDKDNLDVWCVETGAMTARLFYRLFLSPGVEHGLSDYVIAEDGSFGLAVPEDAGWDDPPFFIIGTPERVDAFFADIAPGRSIP